MNKNVSYLFFFSILLFLFSACARTDVIAPGLTSSEVSEAIPAVHSQSPSGFATKFSNCKDPDNQKGVSSPLNEHQLTNVGTTTYAGGSFTDKCYTWDSGTPQEKTRLIEGICQKQGNSAKFLYWYADCDVSFGKGFSCEKGKCVKKVDDVNLVISNVKYLSNGVDVDTPAEAIDFTKPVTVTFDVTNEGATNVNAEWVIEVMICKSTKSGGSCHLPTGAKEGFFKAKETKHYELSFSLSKYDLFLDPTDANKYQTQIRINVDGDNQVVETNEEDNSFKMILNVINVPLPCSDSDAIVFDENDPDNNNKKGIVTGTWKLDWSEDNNFTLNSLGKKEYGLMDPIFGSLEDWCIPKNEKSWQSGKLVELYCASDFATGIVTSCKDGTYCSSANGACKPCGEKVPCPTCYDSDNVNNEFPQSTLPDTESNTRGTVTGFDGNNVFVTRSDACINKGGKDMTGSPNDVILGASAVKEYSCANNLVSPTNTKVNFTVIDCSYGCNEGQCMTKVEADSWALSEKLDLVYYPSFFDKDGIFDGIMVLADTAPPSDSLALTDIASSMNLVTTGSTKLLSEAKDILQSAPQSVILIGCAAMSPADCALYSTASPTGKAAIQLKQSKGKPILSVFGPSPTDTRMAAKLLASWKEKNLKGIAICVSGTLENSEWKEGVDCW